MHRNDRVEIEVVVKYTSRRSREWSDVGRKRSNSGREEIVSKDDQAFGRDWSG